MMTTQPEALRLADDLDAYHTRSIHREAADELRRLHALEADALRYRAIREGLEVDPDNSGIVISLVDHFGGETLRNEIADAAIDAAITKSGGQMITATDLYALTQESPTACYLLTELCQLAHVSPEDVRAPEPDMTKRNSIPDPFKGQLQ